jgi:hypothetical protein
VLFGFDRLMEAVGPTSPRQHAAGELVDDQDAPLVIDHVLLIALVERVCLERLLQNVQRLEVDRVVEPMATIKAKRVFVWIRASRR